MVGCSIVLLYSMLTSINAGSAGKPISDGKEDSIVRVIHAVFVAIPTEDL